MRLPVNFPLTMQDRFDAMTIAWLASKARLSVPRGDHRAAESAFCSEMAGGQFAHLFPWLMTRRTQKRPTGRRSKP